MNNFTQDLKGFPFIKAIWICCMLVVVLVMFVKTDTLSYIHSCDPALLKMGFNGLLLLVGIFIVFYDFNQSSSSHGRRVPTNRSPKRSGPTGANAIRNRVCNVRPRWRGRI